MQYQEIAGRKYPVICQVPDVDGTGSVPLVSIHMMDDETWNRKTKENAVRNFTRSMGRAPVSPAEAVAWQTAMVRTSIAGIQPGKVVEV